MALIETLTVIGNTSTAADCYAYSQLPVPGPVTVRANVPEVWYVHKCYEQITGGSPSNVVSITGNTITITGSGITTTVTPRVGDVVTWGEGGFARLGYITTINPAAAGSINWVLSASTQGAIGAGSNQELWISYQNRRSRLGELFIEPNGNAFGRFFPVAFGQTYLARTSGMQLIEDGDVGTAYYVDASRFVQTLYNGLPFTTERLFANDLEFSWQLLAGSPVTLSYGVRNQTEFSLLMQSYRIGSQTYDVRFNVNGVEVKAGLPTFDSAADGVPTLLPATGPITCIPSHPESIWVQFQSRYGTPMVLPFNYALDQTLETELVGTARRGYDTRNVNMQGYDRVELSTGMISNRFKEWYEDLATSPYVYLATALPNGLYENPDGSTPAPSGPVVLYNDLSWVEYRIEAGAITTKANANDLMALSFTVVKCRQRNTYNA